MITMAIAAEIVDQLRANGFPTEQAVQRQLLALAEEAGEFVGAYRRCAGMARRCGTAHEVRAELADVVITAYVTAAELGVALTVPPTCLVERFDVDPDRAVLRVFAAVNWFVQPYLSGQTRVDDVTLNGVVRAANAAAAALGFDLAAAVAAKLDVIVTRGWREPRPDAGGHTVFCGWGCGYLAASETELDDHEAGCDQDPPTGQTTVTCLPRPAVRCLPRRSQPTAELRASWEGGA